MFRFCAVKGFVGECSVGEEQQCGEDAHGCEHGSESELVVIADGAGRVGLRSENRDRCRGPVSARHTTHCPHDNAENPSGRFEGHRKTSGSWRC